MRIHVRPGDFDDPDDRGLCEEMLAVAASWRDAEPPPMKQLLTDPHLARYIDDLGRPGDAAVIGLEANTQRIGAAWYRLFSADAPGYGYVADDVPELSIGVRSPFRGHGVGGRLLPTLIERAQADGFERLSLSVERDNPAVRLYRRHGFVPLDASQHSWTMILRLSNP